MFEKLKELETEYEKLTSQIEENVTNLSLYQEIMKKRAKIEPFVLKFREYKTVEEEIAKLSVMLNEALEPELKEIAEEELNSLQVKKESIAKKLTDLLAPKDEEEEDRNIIMEIRAGTGGEESGLFVADLFRMYSKYVISQGWKLEIFNSHPTGIGGFKEIIFGVEGDEVFKKLKFESGTHRVQRVPVTEASGRIHTSAVTVAVLKEPEEIDIEISPEDLRIDTFRSSGPGGQHVNVTDSAVRITHLPTGFVVTCQDERSQHKNKAKAMRVLRAELLAQAEEKARKEQSQERKSQVGSGDRSEKIRTYNYPQNRVTDHRIGLSLHRLETIMDGDLDELVFALISASKELKTKNK
ncbi:MAG: peptide chain release factor 1 [bacterium]